MSTVSRAKVKYDLKWVMIQFYIVVQENKLELKLNPTQTCTGAHLQKVAVALIVAADLTIGSKLLCQTSFPALHVYATKIEQ